MFLFRFKKVNPTAVYLTVILKIIIMQETELKVGYNPHRLNEGDPYFKKEIDFVKAINNFIRGNNNTLAKIVNSPNNGGYLDEHEEKIVLSVIQWLGTPVGQSFLERVEKM